MNYSETLDFLYTKLPMFSRIGAAAYKKDLTNIRALCRVLNNPQDTFKSIHIAGTNGKGSVSHMLAAVLQECGYKTGLHTSPHLKDFRERIKINGQMCPEDFVIRFVEKIQPHIKTIDPSFFEISVAMAFAFFAEQQVDIAVIETGLGGRLDSTNILHPVLSVITNIGYDHVNMLGDTLEKIAFEKAGIIKPGTPVVIGEILPETKNVFELSASDKGAPVSLAQHHYYAADWHYTNHSLSVTVADLLHNEQENYVLDLNGIYQVKNLITALDAMRHLQQAGFSLPHKNVKHALQHVKKITGLAGRWQLIHTKPDVILDVAHNEDGIKQVTEQLEHCTYKHLHIITGMVRDKDADSILSLYPHTASYYFTQAHIPRALPAEELAAKALQAGLTGKIFSGVNEALQYVLQHASPEDMILVCGSVFLAGEVDAEKYSI